MVKKVQYVNITPIPSHIPRQLAIDMLHSHGEIIELNPLVLEHHLIKPPRDAPADEFFSVWHEIVERIQYIPGMGRMGSGKITFKGVFHDIPLGLQTHIYAPAGVDMRNRYEIRGNEPGEPPEHREIGSGAPAEGLYIREEVEFKCNFSLAPFVKSQNKAAAKTMLARLVKKAELIDQEILRQMMEAHRNSAGVGSGTLSPQPQSPGFVPGQQLQYPGPTLPDYRRSGMLSNSEVLRQREEALRSSLQYSSSVRSTNSPGFQPPNSMMGVMQQQPQQQQQQLQQLQQQQYHQQHQQSPQQPGSSPGVAAVEMMGDTQYANASNTNNNSNSNNINNNATHSNHSSYYAGTSPNKRGTNSTSGGGPASPFARQLSYSELDGGSQFDGSQASRPSSIGAENSNNTNMTSTTNATSNKTISNTSNTMTSLSSGWGGSQSGTTPSEGPASPRSPHSQILSYRHAHSQSPSYTHSQSPSYTHSQSPSYPHSQSPSYTHSQSPSYPHSQPLPSPPPLPTSSPMQYHQQQQQQQQQQYQQPPQSPPPRSPPPPGQIGYRYQPRDFM